MGLNNVQRNMKAAGHIVNAMDRKAATSEDGVRACLDRIASTRQYLNEIVTPFITGILEDREEGIAHLREAAKAYDAAQAQLEAANLEGAVQGHAIQDVMQKASEELNTVKQQIMGEVFIEDNDRIRGCRTKIENNSTKLKDVYLYFSGMVQPEEGELIQLRQQLTLLGEAVANYGQDRS